jgi:tetratricopeptide (TPR) repeat protein
MSSPSLPQSSQNDVAPVAKKSASPHRRRWILVLLACLIVVLVAGGVYELLRPRVALLVLPQVPATLTSDQLGLASWQQYQQPLPADPLANPALPKTPQTSASLALLQDAAGQALVKQGNLTRGFAYLKAAAQAQPESLRYGNDYRIALRDHGRFQDEASFFALMAQKSPSPNTHIELALTYVDMMRSCPKPPDGLVCQAQFSYRSISVLNAIIAQNPYNIVARFARGLNNLYWPTLMGHLPQAQSDLQYAVALSRVQSKIGPTFVPQAYAALGDVFAKDGKVAQARNVWLNGVNASANPSILHSRLAIAQDQLANEETQNIRGLGVYVDTDLTMFWQKG